MSTNAPFAIPPDRLARNPLLTPAAYAHLRSILQHPDAPAWNYEVGDRVRAEDLPVVESLRERLRVQPPPRTPAPSEAILAWIEARRARVPLFRRHLEGRSPAREWDRIPTMDREDLAVRIEEVVPDDADLSRMIVYDTSGTTGHAIAVPHHPRTMALNHPLMEFVLRQYGVAPDFQPGRMGCVNVGAQRDTVVFATCFAVWNQSAFAKVNLHPRAWEPERARRFFEAFPPLFLTGDPLGFSEMASWEIDTHPAAMLSTAVALSPACRRRLEARYRCPVIDTYATTETGPVAYAAPDGEGMRILPEDIHVEIVDEDGRAVPPGERGEICVTGGRNPYVPLLRYRTGDFARLDASRPGDPRLTDLLAREPVMFRAADGSPVSPVDVGRLLRRWDFVQHAFVQRVDDSLDLAVRPAPGLPLDPEALREGLAALFGPLPRIAVRLDETLGLTRKAVPFRRETP